MHGLTRVFDGCRSARGPHTIYMWPQQNLDTSSPGGFRGSANGGVIIKHKNIYSFSRNQSRGLSLLGEGCVGCCCGCSTASSAAPPSSPLGEVLSPP